LKQKFSAMRVHELYINDYKLLQDFNLSFSNQLSILIGKNGSGKSSVLECILWIFRCAHLTYVENQREWTPFQFSITYSVRIEDVIEETSTTGEFEANYIAIKITGRPGADEFWTFATDNSKYSRDELIEKYGYKKLLPTNVVIYYSGWFETMNFLCEEHEKLYAESLKKRKTSSTKDLEITSEKMFSRISSLPLLNIRQVHFEILLASLYCFEFNDDLDKFFLEKIGINKPEQSTLAISVKKKQWKKGADHLSFWGSEGLLLQFLQLIRDNDLSEFRYDEKNEQYTFIFNLLNWYKVREFYGEEKKVFYLLHMLHASEMLKGIKVFLSRGTTDISQHGLSEGEQQLITIRAINELLMEENSLFLFDEPDTYMHPSWQRTFIAQLDELKGEAQFIISTHSPQILSNLKNGEVQIMELGKVIEITPKFYGRDTGRILFELMGVKERPKEIEQELRNLFRLIDDEKFNDANAQYMRLIEILGKDDSELVRAQILMKILNES